MTRNENKPQVGQTMKVRGIHCRIIKVRPAGTVDVQSLCGNHCFRVYFVSCRHWIRTSIPTSAGARTQPCHNYQDEAGARGFCVSCGRTHHEHASGTVKQGRRPMFQPHAKEPSAGNWTLEVDHIIARDKHGLVTANQSNSVCKLYGPDAEANGKLITATKELLAERQAISKALGEYTWTTPEHAEQILRHFIEKFYDSDAVDKATGTARLDRAVEKMTEAEEDRETCCQVCGERKRYHGFEGHAFKPRVAATEGK